jgi:hypothetical protein
MKMKFRYRHSRIQETLIKRLHDTDIKFRVKADRSIEFAKKWYPDVEAEVNEIRFAIFNKPLIRTWEESIDIALVIHKLADMNIPFLIENPDGIEWIIYDEVDVESVDQVEYDLGLIRFE